MKSNRNLLAGLCLAATLALPVAAQALPAVQRSAVAAGTTQLPAVQSGWLMSLLAQLQGVFGR